VSGLKPLIDPLPPVTFLKVVKFLKTLAAQAVHAESSLLEQSKVSQFPPFSDTVKCL
jgi:hypothetical protein